MERMLNTARRDTVSACHSNHLSFRAASNGADRWVWEEFRPVLRSLIACGVPVHRFGSRGKEKFFVENYEPPQENFLDVDTTNVSVEACIDRIVEAFLS